jgi:hypothetical protein
MGVPIVVAVTIANGEAESGVVSASPLATTIQALYIPAWTAASLAFKVCDTAAGTFAPLRNEFGALIEVTGIATAAAGWYKLPIELLAAPFFKLWSETAGSNTNQGAERVCKIALNE